MPALLPRHPHALGAILGCLTLAGQPLRAQLPSLPAAQSAFPAPGFAVALDGARTDGRNAIALAAATGVRRLQITAAVGLPSAPAGYERSSVSVGARLAARLYRSTRFGASAFVGYGGERLLAPASPSGTQTATGGSTASESATTEGKLRLLPVGVSAGMRGVVGTRPYAISIVPMFAYTRWTVSDSSVGRSGARVAALAEIALTPRIGFGVGGEVGTGGPDGSPFPGRRTAFGAGISYAIQRAVAR